MRFAAIALLSFLSATVASPCVAADTNYPSRPVKIVVQFSPGGVPDLVGKLLAQRLSDKLGQAFFVENRTGANGSIASELVAKSEPDGYTLLAVADAPLIINPSIYKNLRFDPRKDFAPISLTVSSDYMFLARSTLPVSTLAEFIDMARANPGKLTFASSGLGSMHHLAGELLKSATGIQLVHVPFRGFGAAIVDLLAGNVDVMFGGVAGSLPHVREGKAKALGITSRTRLADAPNLPTMIEAGLSGFEVSSWFGLVAPAGTPKPIIDLLYANVQEILRDPELVAKFRAQGLTVMESTPASVAERIDAGIKRWKKVVDDAGIKPE